MNPTSKVVRVAAYMRYSHAEQAGNTSLDVQLRLITAWAAQRNAIIVKIFTDEALSGRGQAKRTALAELKSGAQEGEFDAVCVAFWDRWGRNTVEGTALKRFLRDDCKIAVYAAQGMSEDEGGSTAAFVEGIQDLQAQYYSDELSEKYKRAKYQLFLEGYYNGSNRPFGYEIDKITVGTNRDGTPKTRNTLKVNEHEAAGVLLAFQFYAGGKMSYSQITQKLNESGYRTTKGRLFNPDSLKEIFSNVLYLGQLTYQESRLNKSRTKRYYDNPIETLEGKHPAIIPQELFDAVQAKRVFRKRIAPNVRGNRSYLLIGKVWCYECFLDAQRGQVEGDATNHGKMVATTAERGKYRYPYYSCPSRRKGYSSCTQTKTRTEGIDAQVLDILFNLRVPADWRNRIVSAIADETKDLDIEKRIAQLRTIIANQDERWDLGLVPQQDENDG